MSTVGRFTQALCVGLFATFTAQVAAQDRPSYGPGISIAAAKKVAAGAVAEATKNNWPVAIAIVDTHGFLVYFEKVDDTQSASVQIAIEKARTSAMTRRATRVFTETIGKGGGGLAILGLPGIAPNTGGVPIFVGGKIVGAIGVSGVTGDQDEQIAIAGSKAQ
ncbi:MAG: GlcG/HbpS family heme-binding protein [Burkholderiales bacterium]